MNTSTLYMTVIVFSLVGLFLLWKLGIQRLMLDNFRDSLFSVRDRLYALVQEGQISPDDPAYRGVEALVNGLIRYAHRFTFIFYVINFVEMKTRHTSNADGPATRLVDLISNVKDDSVRELLFACSVEASFLLNRYVARSSELFLILSAIAKVETIAANKKKAIVRGFENEAMKAYSADGPTAQMAA